MHASKLVHADAGAVMHAGVLTRADAAAMMYAWPSVCMVLLSVRSVAR